MCACGGGVGGQGRGGGGKTNVLGARVSEDGAGCAWVPSVPSVPSVRFRSWVWEVIRWGGGGRWKRATGSYSGRRVHTWVRGLAARGAPTVGSISVRGRLVRGARPRPFGGPERGSGGCATRGEARRAPRTRNTVPVWRHCCVEQADDCGWPRNDEIVQIVISRVNRPDNRT